MAAVQIRPLFFMLGKRKAATAKVLGVKMTSGGKAMFGAEGLLAFSHGVGMMEMQVSGPVPVAGSDGSAFIEKFLRQEDVEYLVVVGGKTLGGVAKMTELGFNSDTETGEATEGYTLSGAAPKVRG